MKKSIFIFAVCFLQLAATAQVLNIDDTLKYFTNKQRYRLGMVPSFSVHPVFRFRSAETKQNVSVSHVGSIFRSTGTVTISGLEGQMLRRALSPTGTSGPIGPTVKLYLCNVSSGFPVLPPLDSITTNVLNSSAFQFGARVGGNFSSPKVVTGDFAVLMKNGSTVEGDTVDVFRTAGHTPTSPYAPSVDYKIGEGLGVIRNAGVWYSTRNYINPAFGFGTDYEFCLSPIVHYTVMGSQIESPIQSGACCWQVFTNTNTSTPFLDNPQFNFNCFYRVWRPYGNMPGNFTPDSVFTWDLGDGSPIYTTVRGTNTVNLSFVSGHCNQFYTGVFTANFKKMASLSSPTYTTGTTFTSSTVYCGGDTAGTGIYEIVSLANLKVYPNPASDKVFISGLEGKNTIAVYDMLGQLVCTQVTDKELYVVDLLKQPRGNYLIRIVNADNRKREVKIIKE